MKLELIMPISAGLREDIVVYGGFIGQQYFRINYMMTYITGSKPEYPWDKGCQEIEKCSMAILDDDVFFHAVFFHAVLFYIYVIILTICLRSL